MVAAFQGFQGSGGGGSTVTPAPIPWPTRSVLQSEPRAAFRRVYFTAVSSTALQTRLAAASLSTWTVYLSKNGATPAVPDGGATVTEVGSTNQPGVWYVQLAVTDLDQVGELVVTIRNASAMEPREITVDVGPVARGIATTAAADVRRVYFTAVSAAALQTRLAAASLGTWVVYLSKNGATPAVPDGGASVVEVDATNQPGVWYVQFAAADVDTAGTLYVTVRNTSGTTAMEPRELEATITSAASYTNTTTPEAIRDRLIDVIAALTPASVTGDRFVAHRNDGDFQAWAEAHATGARRRFQVRRLAGRAQAGVSNSDVDELAVTFRVLVAYPKTFRDGPDADLDRDDAIDEDAYQIDRAIGCSPIGRANLAPPYPDACWRPDGNGEDSGIRATIAGSGVDFLEYVVSYSYQRVR